MSVVVYVESQNGIIKKAGLEVASYGRAIANAIQTNLVAVTFNVNDASMLNNHGVDKVCNINTTGDTFFNVDRYSASLAAVIENETVTLVVVSATANGRYLGPILAAAIKAAYVSNVVALPSAYDPVTVKRSCFTNKAFNALITSGSAPSDIFALADSFILGPDLVALSYPGLLNCPPCLAARSFLKR